MDLSFFFTIVALAIGFFTLLRKLRFNLETKENNSLSLPSPSSSLSLPSPSSSLSRNWDHNVFPSFHGPDVRKAFLSHMLKEFRNKGIQPFIDNDIERSKSIGPELKRAIRGSKIAVVLLSKNYASSSWCLDELVEIMECRQKLGQVVVTIFYEVDPTDVKKQTGDFGNAFGKTCQGKTKEKIETWRKALEDVATIAGEHSRNWDNEAAMIEKISIDISNMLNISTLSCGFNRYIGMEAHIEKMKPLLRMDSDEVRMIGIWGPPGIGKSTIARILFHKLSNSFQSRANMNVKEIHSRLCRDEYNAQVQLQSHMLSQMLNQQDLVISHLEVAKQRLNDKKVLLVLDDVDQLAQLDALAENIKWFGRGSRIIIITEDLRVLKKHGINHIYTVDLPSNDEALQIFCMSAFDQNYPKDGFRELAWQIVCHAGKLPLGLKVMGSYFRGMSKREWKNALPKIWRILDGKIESILKFSYDALNSENKELFLHIACFFVDEIATLVEEYLSTSVSYVDEGLDVLANKSLIYIGDDGSIKMHNLLVQLGREIVRNQSPKKPGQRQFLFDSEEISKLLEDDATGSEEVIGIKFDSKGRELNISGRAFEGMSNLQFLKIEGYSLLHLPHGLSYLSSKLRSLHWENSPLTCFPSNVNMKFLVELYMPNSKLEKLWEGTKSLRNLKWMDLSRSRNLKELPDLSTATNLQKLNLFWCLSLVEIPSCIANLHKLEYLKMNGCSKLMVLPVNVNLKSLDELDLSDCSSLKSFPEISTNIRYLYLDRTAIEEVPSSIRSWSRLQILHMSRCRNLKEFAPALDITERDKKIQEVSPLVHGFPHLERLILDQCYKLSSLPQLPDSLKEIDAGTCLSLERLEYSSFRCPYIHLNFHNCFKLNKAARDLIIQTSTRAVTVLPVKEIPDYFSDRANGGSLTVKLNERSFPSSLIFKVCVLVVSKNDIEDRDVEERSRKDPWNDPSALEEGVGISTSHLRYVHCEIMDKQSSPNVRCYGRKHRINSPLTDLHLYSFTLEGDVTSNELLFKFKISDRSSIIRNGWVIKECGVHFGNCEAEEEINEGDSLDEEEEYEDDSLDEEEEYEDESAETNGEAVLS